MKRIVVTLRKQYAVFLILILVVALSLPSFVFAKGVHGQEEPERGSAEASCSSKEMHAEEGGMADPEQSGEGNQEGTEGALGGSEGGLNDPGEGEEGEEGQEIILEPEESPLKMGPLGGGGYAPFSNGEGDSGPSLLTGESDDVEVNMSVNSAYPWTYSSAHSSGSYTAFMAGNSGISIASVSNLAVTVSGPGAFSFDYKTSTYPSGDGYALYYKIGEPITIENYETAMNYDRYTDFRGNVDWTREEFTITGDHLDQNESVTVYIAYLRNGTLAATGYTNFVAIANLHFSSGKKVLTLNIEGSEHGHITENGIDYSQVVNDISYDSGETVSLTAVPGAGKRFYGWVDGNSQLLSTDKEYSFLISTNTSLTAMFAPEGHYAARLNGVFYTTAGGGLWTALDQAEPGDNVVMLENHTMTRDVTIPAGVKLYIPYNAEIDEDGNADGVTTSGSLYQASTKIATSTKTYRTLTINEDVTLTILGTVCIGSVIGYPSQHYQGHTSGWHGKIANAGDIVIEDGGVLDCWGLITGPGVVESKCGGSVYEPFVVYDFAGGWNTAELYFNGQSPFKQYAMQNIQTKLIIQSGATLYGRCNLWASSKYNKTTIIYLGDGGLYDLKPGAKFIRTYDGTRFISTNTDIGKTTHIFEGGMSLSHLSMPIMGFAISTEDVEFPIPYNIDIVLVSGENTYAGRSKVMPGSKLIVEEDASLKVENTLYVLNGLIQSDMSGKYYPTTNTLQISGFSGSGQFIVNGSLEILEGARFGGIVQTEQVSEGASIIIKEGALVNCLGVQDGAVGEYDENSSVFDLPARAYVYDEYKDKYLLKRLYPGREYLAHDDSDWSIDDYTMTYAENCSFAEWEWEIEPVDGKYHNWKTETVSLNEPRKGSWSGQGEIVHDIRIDHETIYGESDGSRTFVIGLDTEDEIYDGGDVQFTVDKTASGQTYVFQVSYQFDNGDEILLDPDAEGIYKIEDVADDLSIKILSCKRGDILQDNSVDNFDLTVLREIILDNVSVSGLRFLSADLFADGEIDNLDLVVMRHLILN